MPPSKPPPSDPFSHPALSDAVRALATRGTIRTYRKGHLLIQEGDTGDTLYVILSGRLRAFSVSDDGERAITYDVYGPGEYVGEMGLDGGPRSAHVEALQATRCAVIARSTLQAHLAEAPDFALELLLKVIRRARAATLLARNMGITDVYGRLKALLLSLGVAEPDGSFVLPERLTQKEIASRLGCSREMVTRVLGTLKTGGYISEDADRRLRWRQLPAGY
jgi:CRP/FNR family cyclic AMP-dependent transcriptional regulator